MKYGNVQLSYRFDSLIIIHTKSQTVRHYPGTDTSDVVPMGRPPTRIMCVLVVKGEDQRRTVEQLFHGAQEADLVLGDRYYKRVVTGGEPQGRMIRTGVWEYNAEFIALDPKPYSVATDEYLY
jgi:hypothetical protein